MRIAVVDVGSNSTRLLVCEVDGDGRVTELERRSTVTRLGQGVDASGSLAPEAIARVLAALREYRAIVDGLGVDATTGVLTSAVRDAANGGELLRAVQDDLGFDADTIPGDLEAQLSFLGATSERRADAPAPVVVIDVGGGSTELVVGERGRVAFHVSTQVGVVRHGERHVHHDPPDPAELRALADDARITFAAAVPADVRRSVAAAVAVAGTATSLAAIDQALEPYDPARVHGHRLTTSAIGEQLARLAQMDEAQRRGVSGLHPDRAVTIVPGCVVLLEALRLFDLDGAEVSEHDILRGAALRRAGF